MAHLTVRQAKALRKKRAKEFTQAKRALAKLEKKAKAEQAKAQRTLNRIQYRNGPKLAKAAERYNEAYRWYNLATSAVKEAVTAAHEKKAKKR